MRQIAKWKNVKVLSTCVAVVMALLRSQPAQADTIYNAVNDFSLASNPNGVWSYGYALNLSSNYSFNLDDVAKTNDANAFGISTRSSSAQGGYPYIGKNQGSAFNSGSAFIPTDELLLHPGPSGQYSILRFTVPTSDTYNLQSTFEGLDSTTTDVHVLYNRTSIFDGSINGFGYNGSSSSGSQPYSISRFLMAGDTIDFAVGFGSNGSYNSDTTGLKANFSIVPTPEPETWAMMALGVSSLAVFGWRRKRGAGETSAAVAGLAI